MKPRIKALKTPDGHAVSFRWFKTGFDLSKFKDGTLFIQFGKKPVKFICFVAKGAKRPKFLLSMGWKNKWSSKRITLGTTTKPVNYAKLWRQHAELNIENRQHGEVRGGSGVRLGQEGHAIRLVHGVRPGLHGDGLGPSPRIL